MGSYTSFESPKAKRIQELRNDLAKIRDELKQMYRGDKFWEGFLSPSVGGITCVIQSSYSAAQEIEHHYQKWEKK